LFIPALALVGAAVAGWPGWLAGLALAWNGVACGQLSGAASAILVARVGPTTALVLVSGVVLLSATVLASSGMGPGAWWLAATEQPAYDLVLVATGVAALVGAWALNRPAEQVVRPGRTVRIPHAAFAAVLVTMLAGVSRSVMARSTIVTAVLTPLLVRSAGQEVTASIAFFVTAAAAAVLGANGFAYDGGAAVWLLGKTSRMQLVLARLVTTTVWAFLLALVAAGSAALVGAAPPLRLLPQLILVAIGAAAAGIVPSVTRPAATDFNSFRAQPAPVASAIGTLARSVVLTTIVLAVPLPLAVAVVLGYVLIAVAHARWALRDPVALAALA
jgi:membrane protease YdiL (CAAX protease family)